MIRAVRSGQVRVFVALMFVLTGCDQVFGLARAPGDATGDGPSATAELVQQVTGSSDPATTLEATLPAPPTSGHVLVMVGAAETAVLASVSGGGVTTWKVAARSNRYQNVEIWYGVTDGSSSTVTIKCVTSCTTTQGPMWMSLGEWSGLATTSLFETGNAANGTASAALPGVANAGAITTIDAPDLLIFGVVDHGTISTQVTGGQWTALEPISLGSVAQSAWYQIVSTTGQFAAETAVTSNWDAAIAAFRIAP